MSIVKHKDTIIAWLNGATIETKSSLGDNWCRIKQAENCDDIYFIEYNEYRIKPKTETTWIWVAEWEGRLCTCMRSTKDPWANDFGEYTLVRPTKVYKIEESKQEVAIE